MARPILRPLLLGLLVALTVGCDGGPGRREGEGGAVTHVAVPPVARAWIELADVLRDVKFDEAAVFAEAEAARAMRPHEGAFGEARDTARASLARRIPDWIRVVAPHGLTSERTVDFRLRALQPARAFLRVVDPSGYTHTPDATGLVQFSSFLPEGRHRIELPVLLVFGERARLDHTVVIECEVDRTGPRLEIAARSRDDTRHIFVRDDVPAVLNGWSEAGATLSVTDIRGRKAETDALSDGRFRISLDDLACGALEIRAADAAGNETRSCVRLERDMCVPEVQTIDVDIREDHWRVELSARDDLGVASVEMPRSKTVDLLPRAETTSAGVRVGTWVVVGDGAPPGHVVVRDVVGRMIRLRLPILGEVSQSREGLAVPMTNAAEGATLRVASGAEVEVPAGTSIARLDAGSTGGGRLCLRGRIGATQVRVERPYQVDVTPPDLDRLTPPPGMLSTRRVAVCGTADEPLSEVRYVFGDAKGRQIVEGRDFELPTLTLGSRARSLQLTLVDVLGNETVEEVAYGFDKWIERRRGAERLRLGKVVSVALSSSNPRAYLLLDVSSRDRYAFEALARRTGTRMGIRIRVRDAERPERVIASNGGIKNRTYRGDPHASATLDPGSYLIEIERRSGSGRARFMAAPARLKR